MSQESAVTLSSLSAGVLPASDRRERARERESERARERESERARERERERETWKV
jgi:hypothetical protein